MSIQFTLNNYETQLGENIYLIGTLVELGDNDIYQAIPMRFINNKWTVKIAFSQISPATYRYFSNLNQDTYNRQLPQITLNATSTLEIFDDWSPVRNDPWYTKIYDVIQPPKQLKTSILHNLNQQAEYQQFRLILRCFAAFEPVKMEVAGSSNQLTNWQTKFKMSQIDCHTFEIELFFEILDLTEEEIEFKFVLNGEFESGENRRISVQQGTFLANSFFRYDKIPKIRISGLNINLKRNRQTFKQLCPIIDLCKKIGFKCLKLNNFQDFSSSFALDIVHLEIEEIELEEHNIDVLRQNKVDFLIEKFKLEVDEIKSKIFQFLQKNENFCYWLPGYAVSVNLGQNSFKQQVDEFLNLSAPDLVYFTAYMQILAFQQLIQTINYARNNNIIIYCKLYLNKQLNSHNLLQFPQFYTQNLLGSVDFGQKTTSGSLNKVMNWGSLKEDNYELLTTLCQFFAQFCEILEIDQVSQFFRAWEIPQTCAAGNGKLGRFSSCNPITFTDLQRCGVDKKRLIEPYLHVNNVVPSIVSYQQAETLLQRGIWSREGDFYRFNQDEAMSCKMIESDLFLQQKVQMLFANRCMQEDLGYPLLNCHPVILNYFGETPSLRALAEEQKQAIREVTNNYFEQQHWCWYQRGIERLRVVQNASGLLLAGKDMDREINNVLAQIGILQVQEMTFQGGRHVGWNGVKCDSKSIQERLSEDGYLVDEYLRVNCAVLQERAAKTRWLLQRALDGEEMLSMVYFEDLAALSDGHPLFENEALGTEVRSMIRQSGRLE